MRLTQTSIYAYCFLVQNGVIANEKVEDALEMLADSIKMPQLTANKRHLVVESLHDAEKLEKLIAFEENYFCYVLSKAIADFSDAKSLTTFTKCDVRAQLVDRMQLSPLYQFVRAEIMRYLTPRASFSTISRWVKIVFEAMVDVQNELLGRQFRPTGKGFGHVFKDIYKLGACGGASMFIRILETSPFRKQLKATIQLKEFLRLQEESFVHKYDKDLVLAEMLVLETVSEGRTTSVFDEIHGPCRFTFFPWGKGIHETVTTIERMYGLFCPELVYYRGFVVTDRGIEVATEAVTPALDSERTKFPPGFFVEVGKLLSDLMLRLHSEGMRLKSLGKKNLVYNAQKRLKILIVEEVEASDEPIDWSLLSVFLNELAKLYRVDFPRSLEKFRNRNSTE